MKQLLLGPVGVGKTRALKDYYHNLVEAGAKTDEILVIAASAQDVSQWRSDLAMDRAGCLQVYTYFGFIQNQLRKWWPIVTKQVGPLANSLQPNFITAETTSQLMGLLVEEAYRDGRLLGITANSRQVTAQLLDNINNGAINGLSEALLTQRLSALGRTQADPTKIASFQEAARLIREFNNMLLTKGMTDYAQAVHLFHWVLLPDPEYRSRVQLFRHLLVDDLDEQVPAAQELLLHLLPAVKSARLAGNYDGGFSSSFGANPQGINQFVELCEVEKLEPQGNLRQREFGCDLGRLILSGQQEVKEPQILHGYIQTFLRGAMVKEVATKVAKLLKEGVKTGEIAIIAPAIDQVLVYQLKTELSQHAVAVANMVQPRRILDQPFAQALTTLVRLAHPQWTPAVNYSALVQLFHLLLGLDPVRAARLAEATFANEGHLPEVMGTTLENYFGQESLSRYHTLHQWLAGQRDVVFSLEQFLHSAFARLVARLLFEAEDVQACRQVVSSAERFCRAFSYLEGEELGRHFVQMLEGGTLAAEHIFPPGGGGDWVTLATPGQFLRHPACVPVRYQFWLDVGSQLWAAGVTKELFNPHVLTVEETDWHWTDAQELDFRHKQLARVVKALLARCTEGIYVANSQVNSRGWEQDGILLAVFSKVEGELTKDV